MTDIQRHLKGIRKLLQNAIEQADDSGQVDFVGLTVKLRAFLPKSYGIGSGCLVDNNGASLPVQLVIYDVPLANGSYPDDAGSFRVEHTLMVIECAARHTIESLGASIDRIASVKRLDTGRSHEPSESNPLPPGQVRRTIPRYRLPFALIYSGGVEQCTAGDEQFFTAMYDLLSRNPVELWPDQIDIIGQQAQFLNPLLERDTATWSDMGWSKTPDLRQPELCYVCKRKFFRRHFFYDRLCMDCGDLNYRKRVQSADLTGYRILLTGGRVKIGYAAALRLLRAGAEVIVTSRFPRDTARRYSQEADFATWQDRLHIYGVDLRQTPRLDAFAQYLSSAYPYLDAIINNAAQTIKRPPAYYAHLIPFEVAPLADLPAPVQALLGDGSAEHLQPSLAGYLPTGTDETFPAGQYDEHGQQIDYRRFTSWRMRLEEVPVSELVEVQLVNAVAPALLAGQIKGLLQRSPHNRRAIVNVSAAEGQFAAAKNGLHPHTNMAKAALNMLTRTIAADYAKDGIYVNSVDPGWVSDQIPRTAEEHRLAAAERLPIDMLDASARVCDPVFALLQPDQPDYGRLLKDYASAEW